MPIDAASHFSGKRRIERRVVDMRVELRGGGAILEGRALDLSEVGIGVFLPGLAVTSAGSEPNAMTALSTLERYFTSGLEVRFAKKTGVRVRARVIRVSTTPKPSPDVVVGCRFDRPLTAQEWTAVLGLPPPETETAAVRSAPRAPLLDISSGPRVQILVFDGVLGVGGGPVYLLDATRGSENQIEGVVISASAPSATDVRDALQHNLAPIRLVTTGGLRWDGPVRFVDATARPGGVVVRFDATTPLPGWWVKRLVRRR